MPNDEFEEIEWNDIKNHNLDFILSSGQFQTVLKKIDNDVDEKGFIIDSKTKEKVQCIDSDEVKLFSLGAILRGTKVFIKKNIASFSQYLSEHEK